MKHSERAPKQVAPRALHFLIADDHPIARSGLHKGLRGRFKNATFEFATSADEAMEASRTGSFDAILLEVATPGRDGFETLSQLRLQCPDTPILIVTVRADETFALLALAGGAAGFIGKSASMPTLVRAVEKILQGRIYLSEKLTRQLSLRLRKSQRARLRQLFTRIELEVLAQIAVGRTETQIVDKLSANARRAIEDDFLATEAER